MKAQEIELIHLKGERKQLLESISRVEVFLKESLD